jgi:hypothetical protein
MLGLPLVPGEISQIKDARLAKGNKSAYRADRTGAGSSADSSKVTRESRATHPLVCAIAPQQGLHNPGPESPATERPSHMMAHSLSHCSCNCRSRLKIATGEGEKSGPIRSISMPIGVLAEGQITVDHCRARGWKLGDRQAFLAE